ncbi:MAG: tRNA pseudouridine(55) synthase TruB [Gammaproteobacteria bacterium]|nr:tRNA pseudouridine(55) synthase TruB [Gammaproteobacteria bacterium]MDH5659353.1 tRNA pseudouridine(55) synthase TruB [Gammaproteobacteria bacterium]
MGRRHKGRNVSGIVLLDKPLGITSNRALQIVKRLYNAAKAGHTGSLDPLATGLLPLCLGEATKVSGFLLDADKSYLATIKLGIKTSSADAEGEIIQTRPVENYSKKQIDAAIEPFLGDIEQIPPMHSALKVDGQPLYKLAHQGQIIERKARPVHIFDIEVLRYEGDELDINVICSKGTYIRTLAEDIGDKLGCGAHLSALRRTTSGPFDLEDSVTLEELEVLSEYSFDEMDALLIPSEDALNDWESVYLSNDAAFYISQGQAVQVAKAPTSGLVRLFSEEQGFIGIGEILDDGRVKPHRLFFIENNG